MSDSVLIRLDGSLKWCSVSHFTSTYGGLGYIYRKVRQVVPVIADEIYQGAKNLVAQVTWEILIRVPILQAF